MRFGGALETDAEAVDGFAGGGVADLALEDATTGEGELEDLVLAFLEGDLEGGGDPFVGVIGGFMEGNDERAGGGGGKDG